MRTIRQLLDAGACHIERDEARMLLAYALRKPREYLLAHDDASVGSLTRLIYRLLVARRRRGMPIAYLTHEKEFFGLPFFVNRHVLIPRPETELLVELVLDCIMKHEAWNMKQTLIDVGTGSGCVPIAIMKHEAWNMKQKTVRAIAIDSSKKALAIAKRNALQHGVKIEFLRGNLLELLKSMKHETWNMEHIILTANLPYLTPKQFHDEPSIQHEPRSALVGGPTGLELYEQLLKQLSGMLHVSRFMLHAFFEIDPSQTDAMTTLVKKYLPDASVEVHKDLAGRDRVITAALPQSTPSLA